MALNRVLILHNRPVLPSGHPFLESEVEVLETVKVVEGILKGSGYAVGKLAVGHDPGVLASGVRRFRPDVVFNLFEGTGGDDHTESCAAGVLDWLHVPYTGCNAQALSLANDKVLTKHLLRSAGLPTADFMVIEDANLPPCRLNWPVIVKPAKQDASIGLDQGSVVCNRKQLQERADFILREFGPPVLVEEFVRGREFHVAVVEVPELTVLPISEIMFIDHDSGKWPIVTYNAKWREHCAEYQATPFCSSAKVPGRLRKRLEHLAAEAFRLTGCRDYCRIDFRVCFAGQPYILEVNPNPDFNPDAGMALALEGVGITYPVFTVQLVRNALARTARPSKPALR